MKFLHGSALSVTIRDVVGEHPADFAVAYWGKDACERLAISHLAEGSRVACDARSGSCNPAALKDLLDRQVEIVDVPGLHAKVYIGHGGVVITSANASANGLGEEDKYVLDNLEAGYLTNRQEDIDAVKQ